MLRIPIDKVEPNMILARPIPAPREPNRYMLDRDDPIPADAIPVLRKLGIREVWIRYRALEAIDEMIGDELGQQQRELYWQVRRNFEQIISGTSAELDASLFEQSVRGLFSFLKENQSGAVLLQKLDAFDNYLTSHTTNVCFLALLVGMKLPEYVADESRRHWATNDDERSRLESLGVGCILHDVGKMRIPPEILHKPAKLTDEEMEIMKRHTVYGYEMVRDQTPAVTADVVLNHHQRFNGAGYPDWTDERTGERHPPLAGKEIAILSRIATIADVYDAATTNRVYSRAKLPVQVLHEMRTWCRGFFDPVVEHAFFEAIPPFPIGQIVTLNDGSEAAVVDFNPHDPTRPKVQLLREPSGVRVMNTHGAEIDLSVVDQLDVTSVDGVDVRPFQRTLRAEQAPVAVASS